MLRRYDMMIRKYMGMGVDKMIYSDQPSHYSSLLSSYGGGGADSGIYHIRETATHNQYPILGSNSSGNALMPYSARSSAGSNNGGLPKNARSIDDVLPYQNMRPPFIITDGFYEKPEAKVYTPGQQGDFGEGDLTRVKMGYGVNSESRSQYGMKG